MATILAHMPRRQRVRTAGLIFHVMNRGVKRAVLFENNDDYFAIEDLIAEASRRFGVRIFCYCIMPNHWHLVACVDADGELSRFMHWLTGLHARRWHEAHGNVGTGAVYQGRFKAIPVQCDEHFLRACRYVEANPVRASLVTTAVDWRRLRHYDSDFLVEWPVLRPAGWVADLDAAAEEETADIRRFINRSAPFGGERWVRTTAEKLGLDKSLRRGRPRNPLYFPESLKLTTFE